MTLDEKRAQRLLDLRLEHIDELESEIQGRRAQHEESVRTCESNLQTDLAALWGDSSLYRRGAGGVLVLDRSQRREIGRRRDRSLDLVDREFRTLERELGR